MNDNRQEELSQLISSLLKLENVENYGNVVCFTGSMNYMEEKECKALWIKILKKLKKINQNLPTSSVSNFQALEEVLKRIKSFNIEGRIASQMPNFLDEFFDDLDNLEMFKIIIISNEIKQFFGFINLYF